MRHKKILSAVAAMSLCAGIMTVVSVGVATTAGADSAALTVVSRGTTTPTASASRVSGIQLPEFPPGFAGDDAAAKAGRLAT